MANVLLDYGLLHSLCLLHFFFLCFQWIYFALRPTNSSIISPFNTSFILPITFFYHYRMGFLSRTQKNQINAYQHRNLHTRLSIWIWYVRESVSVNTSVESLDTFVWCIIVEIIHQRLRKIQDGKSHIDWSAQR